MDGSFDDSRPRRARVNDGGPLALFALEPRSYSEAIGGTIAQLRPRLKVLMVDPEDLATRDSLRGPVLVVCNHRMPEGCPPDVRWVEYRPYEDPDIVWVDGQPESIPDLGLEDLVELVDRLAGNLLSGRLTSR